MLLTLIIAGTLAGGVVSVLLAALLTFRVFGTWINQLVSFAVGVMLGAAFLDILPEAARSDVPIAHLLATVLSGIVTFFLLEKLALWRHAHVALEHDQHAHPHPAGMMILVGDGLHNFVDGILIAAAFLADIKLGLITSAAVIAHEIPQELGDFVVLLRSGYSKRTALILNSISGLASVVGGVLGYFALSHGEALIPYVLAIAAASFIYIAIADLIPGLHQHVGGRALVYQPVLMLAGVALIVLQHLLFDH
jgi:zinc and cadmium transporter